MKIYVIKIGGTSLVERKTEQQLYAAVKALGERCILVHGGGNFATKLSKRLGIAAKMHQGRRITDAAALEVAVMTYAGTVNKRLVAGLQATGVQALGLSGCDGNLLRAHRRSPHPRDFGFVGDIDAVNDVLLSQLLGWGLTPVVCALSHDGNGQLFNTNADTIARDIAVALAQGENTVELIYCMDLPGVLRNPERLESVIPRIDPKSYAELIVAGVIKGGMIPKVENCLHAAKNGVDNVSILATKNLARLDHDSLGTRVLCEE